MVSTSDFRKGTKVLYKNEPYIVVDAQHVKPGKGPAFVRTKLKNLKSKVARTEGYISNSMSYFEDTYMVFTLLRFDYSMKKMLVSPKKIYAVDNGFA